MFRLRQSRPHPQLPSASIQYPSLPASCARHLPRSARHSPTCDLASLLPPVTRHASPITKSFRIRTSEKHASNPFGIRTYKTQDLKPFRMNTSKKTGEGTPFKPRLSLKSFGATGRSSSRDWGRIACEWDSQPLPHCMCTLHAMNLGRPFLGLTEHGGLVTTRYSLCTFFQSETNSAPPAAYRRSLPIPGTAAAAAPAPSLSSLSRC